MKWILVVALAVVVLGLAGPWLARRGLGRLPGDIRVKKDGREYYFPITSTILLSLILTLILRLL